MVCIRLDCIAYYHRSDVVGGLFSAPRRAELLVAG